MNFGMTDANVVSSLSCFTGDCRFTRFTKDCVCLFLIIKKKYQMRNVSMCHLFPAHLSLTFSSHFYLLSKESIDIVTISDINFNLIIV